jgi:Meckel syndrome type 1 protein
MKRLTFCLSLVLGLASASCEDDKTPMTIDAASTTPTADAGAADRAGDGSGGTGDAAPAGMCKGTFSSINRPTLGAATNSAGKCASPGDLDIICSTEVRTTAQTCGASCFINAGPAMLATCTKDCIKKMHPTLSDGCTDCYLGIVGCSAMNCSTLCIDPTKTAECMACQVAAGCFTAFFQCSGLPSGSPAPGDGGAGDGGGASDAGSGDGAAPAGDAARLDTVAPADAGAADAPAADAPAADAAASADTAPADAPAADAAAADAAAADAGATG